MRSLRDIPQTSKELVRWCSTNTCSTCTRWLCRGELIASCQLHAVEGRLTAQETDGMLRFRTT